MVSAPDLTLPAGSGMVNIRVGAILMKGPQFLMAGNTGSDYLYSVGGRIKFCETAEAALLREVYEETGYKLKVDRLGFIYENRFVCDWGSNSGKKYYEIGFFFYMAVPDSFNPVCTSSADNGHREFLRWVSPDDTVKYYPEFFASELKNPSYQVRHMVTNNW